MPVKLHPSHSCILIQESYWITIHIYLVKQFRIESSDMFVNFRIFPKFRCLLYQSVPPRLKYYHCVSTSSIISKIVRFSHSFVDSCIETICHHKGFTRPVLLWEIFISLQNNLFHTKMFLERYRSTKGPHLLRMVQPIRSPENPGTSVVSIGHWTLWPEE